MMNIYAPTRVFSIHVGRYDVSFTRHAINQYQRRICPDSTYKQAREHLKQALREGEVTFSTEPPCWITAGRWSRWVSHRFMVVDNRLCLPLNRDLDGEWWCPTVMVNGVR